MAWPRGRPRHTPGNMIVIRQASEIRPDRAISTIRGKSVFKTGFLKGKSFAYACVHHPGYVQWLYRHNKYNFSSCAMHEVQARNVRLQCANVS